MLLFDQVPRNVFRGTPRAFATDRLALAIAHRALNLGFDTAHARQASAVPRHAADAQRSRSPTSGYRSEVFRRINRGSNLAFARSHYRMIARFGRFPHRNGVLGRQSTPAEKRAVADGFAW